MHACSAFIILMQYSVTEKSEVTFLDKLMFYFFICFTRSRIIVSFFMHL